MFAQPSFAFDRLGLVLLAVLSFAGSAACGGKQPTNFPLQWASPASNPNPSGPVTEGLTRHLIKLQPLGDVRPDKTKIGEWEGENTTIHTPTNVAEWCGAELTKMLTSAGAKLVESGETIEIRGEILEFNVLEGGMFNGEVRIRFNIVGGGKATWEGRYAGKSKRWGGSHKPENFNEALTNAFQEATRQLLQDEGFGKALVAVAK